MASLQKTYNREKLFGQVYTPDFMVDKILNDVGFVDQDVLGKTVLDPACGDGRFLVKVAKRIIAMSPNENLRENLEHIYGWDIDPLAVRDCIQNLNELVNPLGIFVDWNIYETNAIWKLERRTIFSQDTYSQQFDFIVGNPPYIRIQHLEEEQRRYIQANYDFCQNGSTDIYIAFFELALFLLSENGTCGFITPNTFFYTETARALREYFARRKNIYQISNYADIQVFNNATTYSAITVFGKKPTDGFLFQKATSKTELQERKLDASILNGLTWQLTVGEHEKVEGKRLGDIAKIHVGITTLCDKAYIFKIRDWGGEVALVESRLKGLIKIEKAILKPIIKGSTLKNSQQGIAEVVLFPYKKVNGKHQIIQEEEIKNIFPLAYNYLLSIKPALDKRDNGEPNKVAWYAFGRSQGLDTSFGKKIIFSPMNHRPNFVLYENEDCTFYSGYCIKFNGDSEWLLEQLNSERMQRFIEVSSRDFRGGWKAYNKKAVENFIVEMPPLMTT